MTAYIFILQSWRWLVTTHVETATLARQPGWHLLRAHFGPPAMNMHACCWRKSWQWNPSLTPFWQHGADYRQQLSLHPYPIAWLCVSDLRQLSQSNCVEASFVEAKFWLADRAMKRIDMFLFIVLLVFNPLHSVQAVTNQTELIHAESSPDRTANTVDTLIFGWEI